MQGAQVWSLVKELGSHILQLRARILRLEKRSHVSQLRPGAAKLTDFWNVFWLWHGTFLGPRETMPWAGMFTGVSQRALLAWEPSQTPCVQVLAPAGTRAGPPHAHRPSSADSPWGQSGEGTLLGHTAHYWPSLLGKDNCVFFHLAAMRLMDLHETPFLILCKALFWEKMTGK